MRSGEGEFKKPVKIRREELEVKKKREKFTNSLYILAMVVGLEFAGYMPGEWEYLCC